MSNSSANDIVDYLKRGGYASELAAGAKYKDHFVPWTLVQQMEGEKLARWYEGAKLERDLAEILANNPQRHAELMAGKDNVAKRTAAWNRIFDECRASGNSWKNAIEEYRLANLDLYARADDYLEFKNNSIFGFRAEDYPIDNIWASHTSGVLLSYALFQNSETGDYFIAMQDSRDTYNFDDRKKKPAIVDFKELPANDRSAEEIIEAAKWAWAEHRTHWMRFSPITERSWVDALHEADRLRTHFKAGASDATDREPARPQRNLFEFYPAFRRAYDGKDGYLQALKDIYGSRGNLNYSREQLTLGKDIVSQINVDPQHFVGLYEQMSDKERQDFANAVDEFTGEELLHTAGAEKMASDIAIIQAAINSGSGGLMEGDNAEAMQEAKRLRVFFKSNSYASEPAHPSRNVFEYFPAFHHAYDGKDGFLQALKDIYGPQGNLRYCKEQGVEHNHWHGYNSGADIAMRYEVHAGYFVNLYEKMSDADRRDFAVALDEFVATELPNVGEGLKDGDEKFSFEHSTAGDLAVLKLAVDHGSGERFTVNHLNRWSTMETQLLARATGDEKWARMAAYRKSDGPIF